MGTQEKHPLRRWFFRISLVVLILIALIAIGNLISYKMRYSDDDPNRGAVVPDALKSPDALGDQFSQVIYPQDQGWTPAQSLFFYNTTQGSDMLPYDFFMVLEQPDSQTLFRDPAHMNQLRYLVQGATSSNPDALPVGFVKDTYQGPFSDKMHSYLGMTCAACHTGQVNLQRKDGGFTAVRIDGAPTMADMPQLLAQLREALTNTLKDAAKRQRFVAAVLKRGGDYANEQEVLHDLKIYNLRLTLYNTINRPITVNAQDRDSRLVHYGYARLDAFGRIFNRVIENSLTRGQIQARLLSLPVLSQSDVDAILDGTSDLLSSRDRDEIVLRTNEALAAKQVKPAARLRYLIEALRTDVFNPANAPVSYPFLWDIAQHDYVQWNGIAANAGVGPLGRNVGEVIGVFGTLDWHLADRCRLADILTGQCSLFGKPSKEELIRFTTSVNMRNLSELEQQLAALQSPAWDDPNLKDLLPQVDTNGALYQQGKALFQQRCVMCHNNIDRSDPNRKVVAFMGNVDRLGTDGTMADNSVSYRGKSGLFQNMYVSATGSDGKLVVQEEMPVAALLTLTTTGVVATPDPDKGMLRAGFEWLMNLVDAFTHNPIKATLKQGDYTPGTDANPFAPLRAYKGRPLNGIWATAPYLHNGSVPTLYHLLLPAAERPAHFMVGSRELDTEKVGFKYAGYDGFDFDTGIPGNSNQGHEYAACGTPTPGLRSCVPLDHDQRMALVEYMKTL